MPFSWQSEQRAQRDANKANAMYEQEIAELASLLLRLGISEAEALRRLRQRVQWEFELHGTPAHLATVKSVVSRVYTRRGVGAGTPSI